MYQCDNYKIGGVFIKIETFLTLQLSTKKWNNLHKT